METIIGQVIVGVTSLVALLFQLIRPKRNPRKNVIRDIKILNSLPAGSTVRAELEQFIESQIRDYSGSTGKRRDWSGAAIAAVFLGLSALIIWVLHWHWSVAVPFTLMGIYGSFESLSKEYRDPRGIRLKIVEEEHASTPVA